MKSVGGPHAASGPRVGQHWSIAYETQNYIMQLIRNSAVHILLGLMRSTYMYKIYKQFYVHRFKATTSDPLRTTYSRSWSEIHSAVKILCHLNLQMLFAR